MKKILNRIIYGTAILASLASAPNLSAQYENYSSPEIKSVTIYPGAEEVPYASRFSKVDQQFLRERKILPEVANDYASRFGSTNIAKFVPLSINPNSANSYDKRFSVEDIIFLSSKGIVPQLANNFRIGYSPSDIDSFLNSKISSELANSYTNFSPSEIETLARRGILSKQANDYKKFARPSVPITPLMIIELSRQKVGTNELKRVVDKLEIQRRENTISEILGSKE